MESCIAVTARAQFHVSVLAKFRVEHCQCIGAMEAVGGETHTGQWHPQNLTAARGCWHLLQWQGCAWLGQWWGLAWLVQWCGVMHSQYSGKVMRCWCNVKAMQYGCSRGAILIHKYPHTWCSCVLVLLVLLPPAACYGVQCAIYRLNHVAAESCPCILLLHFSIQPSRIQGAEQDVFKATASNSSFQRILRASPKHPTSFSLFCSRSLTSYCDVRCTF